MQTKRRFPNALSCGTSELLALIADSTSALHPSAGCAAGGLHGPDIAASGVEHKGMSIYDVHTIGYRILRATLAKTAAESSYACAIGFLFRDFRDIEQN